MCGQFWEGWSVVLILFTVVCFRGVIVASTAPKKGDSSYPLTRDEKRIWTNLLFANMSQIYRCWGVNIRQTWQMLHLASYLHLRSLSVFRYANVAFTIFTIYLLLTICMFETYLQGANLCKSIFSSSVYYPLATTTEDSLTVQIYHSRLCHVNTNTELLWSDPCGK